MTSTECAQPSIAEVEEQLKRMLVAKRFQNAPNQSDFLKLAVKRALQGRKTPGHVIAKALFPGKFLKDESTDVRVTASNLRRTLAKYFEAEGADDPVRINLPEPPEDKRIRPGEGEAYTPIFTYHPFQAVSFQYRMAETLLSQDAFGRSKAALDAFGKVLELAPEHIGAAIGLAESWCCMLYWAKSETDEVFVEGGKPIVEATALEATKLLDRVEPSVAKYWKIHAVRGFLHAEMNCPDLAKACFAKAFSLSPTSTESYPPYLQFLIRSGETVRGLRLAERYFESRLGDVNAYIAFADILLCAGKYDAASDALEAALNVHGRNGLVHQRLFLLRLVQRRMDEVVAHGRWIVSLLDPFSLEATISLAKRLVDVWPEEERETFHQRIALEEKQRQYVAKVLSEANNQPED